MTGNRCIVCMYFIYLSILFSCSHMTAAFNSRSCCVLLLLLGWWAPHPGWCCVVAAVVTPLLLSHDLGICLHLFGQLVISVSLLCTIVQFSQNWVPEGIFISFIKISDHFKCTKRQIDSRFLTSMTMWKESCVLIDTWRDFAWLKVNSVIHLSVPKWDIFCIVQ